MAANAEELPPLVQDIIARYNAPASQQGFDALAAAARRGSDRVNDLLRKTNFAQFKMFRDAQRRITEETRRGADNRERVTRDGLNREEALFRAHLEQHQRLQVQAAQQDERRDKQRLERLAARQAAAAKQQLQDTKQAEDRDRDVRRQADRIEAMDHDHALKAERERQRKADWVETHEREQKFKQATADHASHLRMREQRQAAADRVNLAQVTAHQDRITARHKAMWSVVRTLTESGSRFMSSITQSGLRSMGNAVTYGLRRITGVHRREGDRQNAIVRGNLAQQNEIVSRAMIRQQGIINSAQSLTSGGGAIAAFSRMRLALLGAGGLYGAMRAIQPGVDFNLLQQQSRAALETILGTKAAANSLFDQLLEFSKTSPFPLQNFIQATQKMAAFGFEADSIVPTLSIIQDGVAAFGGSSQALNTIVDVFAKIKANGKIQGEELNRLGDVGVNALEILAESAGVTAEEMRTQISAGAVDSEMALSALTSGMEERFGGAAEAVKGTWVGATDRIKAAWRDLTSTIVAPFINPMGGGLAIGWANSLADALRVVEGIVESLFEGTGAWEVARSALMGIGIALGAILAARGAQAVIEGLNFALKAMVAVVAASPILALATALTVIGTVLYRHNDAFNGFIDGFVSGIRDFAAGPALSAFTSVTDAFRSVASVIAEELAPNLAVLFRWIDKGEWLKALQSLGGIFTEGFGIIAEKMTDFASNAVEFLRPFAGLLVSAFEYAFWSVQVWLNSGGAGRLWDTLFESMRSVVNRLREFDWTMVVRPALIALSAAVAYAIGGIPLLLGTALIALSPRLREGIMGMLSGAGDAVAENLPGILFNALHDAAEFLAGPALATIFSPVGVRIIAGIAGAAVAGAYAIATGIIDGLKRSLPSVIDAVQGLMSDIIQTISEALGDIPVLGGLLAEAFFPLEVALHGILPTLGLFVDIIRVIPTPVIAASAAIYGLIKAWQMLHVTARAQGVLRGFTGMLDTIALRTMYAGDAIGRLGTRMTSATAPAIMNGAASRVQIAMGAIGMAARNAGSAISAVGAAMPAIGMAAAIGIPVVLGLLQQAKAKQKAWREEINRTAQAIAEGNQTAKEWLTGFITGSSGAVDALSGINVTIGDLYDSLSGSAETTGEFFSNFGRMGDELDKAGISMSEFGAAVLEGDRAVKDLLKDANGIDWQNTALGEAWTDIPAELRDAADQMAENARLTVLLADARGELNKEEERALELALAQEHPESALIDLAAQHTERLAGQTEATRRQADAYQNMRDRIDEVANSTSLFNDVLDRLTGNALPLTRVRENIEDAIAAFRELMNDPEASPSEQERAFTDYAEAIRTAANDLISLDTPMAQVSAAYETQRQALLDQLTAFLGSRDAAEDYATTVLGIPPMSETVAEFVVSEANRRVDRLKERITELGNMAPSPRVELRTANAQAKLEDLERYLEIVAASPWVADFHVRVQADWEDFLRNAPNRDEIIRNLEGIPHAKGGLVTRPELALIGEAGPELILPLSDPGRMAELLAQNASRLAGAMPTAGASTAAAGITTGAPTVNTDGITAWIAGTAAALAPLGDAIAAATEPGLARWVTMFTTKLDNLASDFKEWGRAMTATATLIGTSIASAMTSALREGRGEVVRIVRGYGRSLASALNPLLEAIGEQPVTMEFAKGGIVESREGAQVHVFNEGRRGRGSSHGEAYIPFDPANKPRSQALATETVRRLGGDVQWYARGGLSPEAIRRGQAFARAQDGKPYVWGGVGPNGYDCSGLASAIVNAVRGEDPYRRLFTSGSLVAGASAGLLPGLGQVSVGARSGSPGHVSSTIAGLNAESTGDHVRIGAAARSAADFPSRWHLGSGVYIGPNGTVYPLPEIPEVGRGELGRLGSGWMRYVKDRAQRFVDENTYTGTAFGGPESGVPSGMMVGDGSPEVFAAIRRAMGIVGVPSSWLGPLLTLIGRESSFNPRAYNGILGASGLMQTIPSTFAAYHLDPWNNIFGPTDNVIAGLRYIIGRYGSIFNVGQAMSPTPTRGYSYGGVVDREGLYRLAEGNRREMVLPLENPSRTSALLRRLGVDTGPTDEMVRPARANVEMGSVIGVMNVNTNAADPETVATITTNKIDQRVRQIMAGV